MTVQSTQPKKLPTGVEGLDVLLGGGLPEKRTILVLGGPGSGKSILCTQFLKEGLEKYNEGTIYVSLDYSKKAFMHDMLQFGWDFETHEKNGRFLFLEGAAIRRLPQTTASVDDVYTPDDLTLEDLIDLLSLHIEKIGAKRVVIDDLTALTFRFPDDVQRRGAILSLIEALSSLDVTTVIISEALGYGIGPGINIEEYLSDGVVGMFLLKDGIEVYPTETIFSEK